MRSGGARQRSASPRDRNPAKSHLASCSGTTAATPVGAGGRCLAPPPGRGWSHGEEQDRTVAVAKHRRMRRRTGRRVLRRGSLLFAGALVPLGWLLIAPAEAAPQQGE